MEKYVIQVKVGDKWRTVEKPTDRSSGVAWLQKFSDHLKELGAEEARLLAGSRRENEEKIIWKQIDSIKTPNKDQNKVISFLSRGFSGFSLKSILKNREGAKISKGKILALVVVALVLVPSPFYVPAAFNFATKSGGNAFNLVMDIFKESFFDSGSKEYTVLLDRLESLVETYENAPRGMNQTQMIEFMSDVAVEMTRFQTEMRDVGIAIKENRLSVSQSQRERYLRLNQRMQNAMLKLQE